MGPARFHQPESSSVMPRRSILLRRAGLLLGLALAIPAAPGCGTLMHPDRQGQLPGERLDPAVLVLDGAGVEVEVRKA